MKTIKLRTYAVYLPIAKVMARQLSELVYDFVFFFRALIKFNPSLLFENEIQECLEWSVNLTQPHHQNFTTMQ